MTDPKVSATPEAPTLAQMRAWLERQRHQHLAGVSASTVAHNVAMLDAILAALGETGEPVAFVPMDSDGERYWAQTRHTKADAMRAMSKVSGYDGFEFVLVPLIAAAPRPTEDKPDAH